MSTSSIASYATTSTSSTDTSTTTTRTAKSSLGQEDFLQLLTVQLANQDPMSPMEDTAFIAQMAQFTALEQSTAMNTQMTNLTAATQKNAATTLLGREVTVLDSDGAEVSGTVDAVDTSTSDPRLSIGGVLYSLDSVTMVKPVTTSTTSGG